MSFSATMSLLILSLEDLFIVDSRVLKPSTISVLLSISFLKSSKISLIYLGAPMLGAYVYNVYVFLISSSLDHYEVSFPVSFYGLYLESILFDMNIATPAFFSCPFAWNIFSNPSLSVYVGILS